MADLNHIHRQQLATFTLIVLVLVIPILGGLYWIDHKQSSDNARLLRTLHAAMIASCKRGNAIRLEHNHLVVRSEKAASLLLKLELLENGGDGSYEKLQLIEQLGAVLSEGASSPMLPIVDCDTIIEREQQ